MSKIEDIVNTLEIKISKVLEQQKALTETNLKLKEEVSKYQQKLKTQEVEIISWSEKYETLKIANSMLGSDENKRETKLKINALIRDIDFCIGQLSKIE